MPKFVEDLEMQPREPWTDLFFQQLAGNQDFLNQLKIECRLRNVKDTGKQRAAPHIYLVNEVAVYSTLIVTHPGGDLRKGAAGFENEFSKRFDFPNNAFGKYFDQDHLPVVTISPAFSSDTPDIVALTNVNPNSFLYFVKCTDDVNIKPSKEFYFNVLAIGLKGDYFNEVYNPGVIGPPVTA